MNISLKDEKGNTLAFSASYEGINLRTFHLDGDLGPLVQLDREDALLIAAEILKPYGMV